MLWHALPAVAQVGGPEAIRGELSAGRYPEAERRARGLLATTERLHGVDSRELADVLDLLSEALRKEGKSHDPEALEFCLRAVAIKERRPQAADSSLAISLENLGALRLNNDDLGEARPPLERALELRVRSLGPWHPDVAWSLIWLANLESRAARYDTASVLVQRAVAIQDSVLPDNDLKRTQGLGMLAALQYLRGEYREAAALYERILRLRLESKGLDHPATADALHNLGSVLAEMGDYGEAERYLEQARAVMRRVLSPSDPLIAPTLDGLAILREKRGDPAGALALLREAVRIERSAYGPDHAMVGWYLMKFGRMELALGRRAAARRALLEALRIQENKLGPQHRDLALTLTSLAEVDAKDGSVDLAVEECGRALDIQERALGPRHPDIIPTLADLARYHAMKRDTVGAFDLALRSSRIRTEHLYLTAGGLSENQALAYAATCPNGLGVAFPLTVRAGAGGSPVFVREAWDALVRERTLVLDEMAERHNASLSENVDSATVAAAAALRRARQRLANILVRQLPDTSAAEAAASSAAYQAVLRSARLDVERADGRLGLLSRNHVSESVPRPGLVEVLAGVPHRWGLVAYATYADDSKRPSYIAFVFGGSGVPTAIPIGDASRIDPLVKEWAAQVTAAAAMRDRPWAMRAEAACRAAGGALRKAIWDPVLDALGTVEGVLIVPAGSLQRVNFGALPDSGKSYLVERSLVMHYATSESDIAATHTRTPHGSGLLAIGGVEFGTPPANRDRTRSGAAASGRLEGDCDRFYDATFRPLPESRREVEEIAKTWGDEATVTLMTSTQATENAFKRSAPGKRVIHLATHGFFLDPNRCLQELASSRGIGGLETTVRPRPRPAFDQASPLLLSGLALAAANRRSEATPHEEDGILTAEEVASLDLRGVEWAVLSACDTGIASTGGGEGILGLRRAFRTAGASTLVISLWPVQDEAAREWMRALYKNRLSGGTATAQAVRSATLDVLRSRRAQGLSTSPFFWAAFVATGDWD